MNLRMALKPMHKELVCKHFRENVEGDVDITTLNKERGEGGVL